MKINLFGGQTATIKQESVHYINARRRNNYTNHQSSQRGSHAVERIRMEHKKQEDSNNGTQILKLKNNVTNVATNTVKDTYNPVRQRIIFVQNMPSADILQKFVDPQMLTTWEIDMKNNKKRLRQKVSIPKTVSRYSLSVHQKNGWNDYQIYKFLVMTIAEAFENKSTAKLSEDDLNGHIVKLKKKYR